MADTSEQKPSLLTLPPELRNHIYENVVHTEKVIIDGPRILEPTLALAAVCQQTLNEYLPIKNYIRCEARVFEFHVYNLDFSPILSRIGTLSPTPPGHEARKFEIMIHVPDPTALKTPYPDASLTAWPSADKTDVYQSASRKYFIVGIDWSRWTECELNEVLLQPFARRGMDFEIERGGDKDGWLRGARMEWT